jgi:hypothetical protein
MTQPGDTRHLISERAITAMTLEKRASENLRTILGVPRRFADVLTFNVPPVYDGTSCELDWEVIHGQARDACYNAFRTMQCVPPVSMIPVPDDEKVVLAGFIPYFAFKATRTAEESIYAFYHEDRAAVVMLTVSGDLARKSAMRVIVDESFRVPAGKICCECGARRVEGAPKLKKCPCKKVRYCSKECQKAHWRDHRVCCDRGAN